MQKITHFVRHGILMYLLPMQNVKQYLHNLSRKKIFEATLIIHVYNLIGMHRTNMAEWDRGSRSL